MGKKLVFYCADCGNEVVIDESEYSEAFDVVCDECQEIEIEEDGK